MNKFSKTAGQSAQIDHAKQLHRRQGFDTRVQFLAEFSWLFTRQPTRRWRYGIQQLKNCSSINFVIPSGAPACRGAVEGPGVLPARPGLQPHHRGAEETLGPSTAPRSAAPLEMTNWFLVFCF